MKRDITFGEAIELIRFSDNHVVQIYCADLLNTKSLEGLTPKELEEAWKNARVIMAGASNVKEKGFLYPILKNRMVVNTSIGEDVKMVTFFVKGEPDELKRTVRDAAEKRKAYVMSHNLERYTGQLKADFVMH